MSRIAIATLQNGWDCRWSRPDDDAGPTSLRSESVVCERTGVQRRVSLVECEGCVHWEFAHHGPETVAMAASALHEPLLLPDSPPLVARGLYLATWVAIVATALLLIAGGLVILTTPLAIPVTVMLFLTAAALVGFACTGQLPRP
jgi:hypothetical protein